MTGGIPEDARFSRCRGHEPQEHAHRRRLPGAVGAEKAEDAAPRDPERQMVYRDDLAVLLREFGRFDDVSVWRGGAGLFIFCFGRDHTDNPTRDPTRA